MMTEISGWVKVYLGRIYGAFSGKLGPGVWDMGWQAIRAPAEKGRESRH